MSSDRQRQIEREWIAAAAERDRLRKEAREAKQGSDAEVIKAAMLRLKQASERCNAIMANYQAVVGPPPVITPKSAVRRDTVKSDAARELVAALAELVEKAENVGIGKVAKLLERAKEEANRMVEAEAVHS